MTDTSMRLFVAVDLDDPARQAIANVRQRVAKTFGHGRGLKWVDDAHLHLTLAFLGEIAETAASDIVHAFSADIGIVPFDAVFQHLGVFPSHGGPRVLWVGISQGADEIVEVQREVANRCHRFGAELEGRPFHPHLTVARWRSSEKSRQSDAIRALSADPLTPIARINVDHVTLYHSRLTQTGPIYSALARATLT